MRYLRATCAGLSTLLLATTVHAGGISHRGDESAIAEMADSTAMALAVPSHEGGKLVLRINATLERQAGPYLARFERAVATCHLQLGHLPRPAAGKTRAAFAPTPEQVSRAECCAVGRLAQDCPRCIRAVACASHSATTGGRSVARIGDIERCAAASGLLVAACFDTSDLDDLPLGENPGPGSSAQRVRGDVSALYQQVAPATVIVLAGKGGGSGVVLDPEGWVLTNHHVARGGRKEEFVTTVDIQFGHPDANGVMHRSETSYLADVYKWNPRVDLALLKIRNPPAELKWLPLAVKVPVPGQPVAKVGHAGIGLLWAIADGEIASTGRLSEMWAKLIFGTSSGVDMAEELSSVNPGKVIQSSCSLAPGDSGGPLVNHAGELVGLNAFGFRDPRSPVGSNYHIHVDEIRDFLKERPTKPLLDLSDPWLETGTLNLADLDLDGKPDVVLTRGEKNAPAMACGAHRAWLDVDQDTPVESWNGKELSDLLTKRFLDTDVLVESLGNDRLLVRHDTDADREFDVMLLGGEKTGRVTSAYRQDKNGSWQKDPALGEGVLLRPELLPAKDESGRLARLMSRIVGRETLGDRWVPEFDRIPDPLRGGGFPVRVVDLDGNGQGDFLALDGPVNSGWLMDLDEDTLPSFRCGSAKGPYWPDTPLDAEFSLVEAYDLSWLFYDTDNDGTWDRLLEGKTTFAADRAFRRDSQGAWVESPEDLGRRLIRPDLLRDAPLAKRLRDALSKVIGKPLVLAQLVSRGEGVESLPGCFGLPGTDEGFSLERRETGDDSTTDAPLVFKTQSPVGEAFVADLDRSMTRSLTGGKRKQPPRPPVGHKAPDKVDGPMLQRHADFALLASKDQVAWAWYDTDGVDGLDLVLFSSSIEEALSPLQRKALMAYRIGPLGTMAAAPEFVGQPLVRSDRVSPRLRPAFEAVVPSLGRVE